MHSSNPKHSGGKGKQVSVSLRPAKVASNTNKTEEFPKERGKARKIDFVETITYLSGSSDLLYTSHFTNQAVLLTLKVNGRKALLSPCCYCLLMLQLCWASSVALFQSWPNSFVCLRLNLIDIFLLGLQD